jgi:uncharacterized membrane protein
MHHVTRARSIAKALSWRLLGALDTFLLSYLLTGHAAIAGAIVSVEFFTKTALYYAHERGWDLIEWGHVDTPPLVLDRLRHTL